MVNFEIGMTLQSDFLVYYGTQVNGYDIILNLVQNPIGLPNNTATGDIFFEFLLRPKAQLGALC